MNSALILPATDEYRHNTTEKYITFCREAAVKFLTGYKDWNRCCVIWTNLAITKYTVKEGSNRCIGDARKGNGFMCGDHTQGSLLIYPDVILLCGICVVLVSLSLLVA